MTLEEAETTNVKVNAKALYEVLNALMGPDHRIRELQAIVNLPTGHNPIKTLLEDFNREAQLTKQDLDLREVATLKLVSDALEELKSSVDDAEWVNHYGLQAQALKRVRSDLLSLPIRHESETQTTLTSKD